MIEKSISNLDKIKKVKYGIAAEKIESSKY